MRTHPNNPNRYRTAQSSAVSPPVSFWPAALTLSAVAVGSYVLSRRRKRPFVDPTTDFTDFGFTRKRMAVPGGQMNYYETGAGQPLIFLHGIGGGASS